MMIFWNYIYAPFAAALILVWTLICSSIAFAVSFSANTARHNAVIAVWARFIIFLIRVDVEVFDKDKLPKTGCLLLFNHLSLLDIPLIYYALGSDFRFGAKIELFSIPVFGHALKRYGFLPIERNNRANTLNTYAEAKERSLRGEKFILAPEGTRQTELKLGSFKSGPFILAIQAQIPITPVVISGPEIICPKNKLIPVLNKRVACKVKVLDTIATNNVPIDDRNKIKDIAWKNMNTALVDLMGE